MKRISKILFLGGVAALLLIPMLTTNIKTNQVSEIDNRQLQEFPAFQTGGFRNGIEGYVMDRVGFRSEMITAYQIFCDDVFHKLVHPAYIYGKGDYIMAPWDLTTYQHLDVNEEYVENFTDYLKSLQQFCQNQGMEFLFYLCPNKETIYPEYFADGYNVKEQPNRSDRIIDGLEEKEVIYLTSKEMFLTLKKDEQLYNIKYDAGHWNDTGAFYGHKQIINYLNSKFPGMGMLRQEEFEKTQLREETLQLSYFKIDEMVPYYKLVNTDAVEVPEVFEQITLRAPNAYHQYFKNEAALRNGAPKVLIFGDSYFQGESAFRFYVNHCAELVMLHAENMPDAEYYISAFQPDIVIYEVVERQLESTWDDFKAAKRYYNLSKLQNNSEGVMASVIGPVSLDVDMVALQQQAAEGEIVSFCGSLNHQIDTLNVYALAAILNGREYYAAFDKSTSSYSFAFRAEDVEKGSGISFFLINGGQ